MNEDGMHLVKFEWCSSGQFKKCSNDGLAYSPLHKM